MYDQYKSIFSDLELLLNMTNLTFLLLHNQYCSLSAVISIQIRGKHGKTSQVQMPFLYGNNRNILKRFATDIL